MCSRHVIRCWSITTLKKTESDHKHVEQRDDETCWNVGTVQQGNIQFEAFLKTQISVFYILTLSECTDDDVYKLQRVSQREELQSRKCPECVDVVLIPSTCSDGVMSKHKGMRETQKQSCMLQ